MRRFIWIAVTIASALTAAAAADEPAGLRLSAGSARIAWLKTFASDGNDWINDIVPLKEGGLLAVGFLNRMDGSPPSDWRALAVKLMPDGSTVWSREYGAGGEIDAFWTARELDDGKLMFGGFTSRIGPGGINAYFALTDGTGKLLKENGYGTPGYDRITSLAPTKDGFIGVGHAAGEGERDLFLIGTDKIGAELWRRITQAPGSNGALYVEPAGDGNFIVAGGTDETGDADILVLKVDAQANEIWRKTIGTAGKDDINHGLVVMPDGRIVIPGYTQSWGAGERDFMAAVLDRDGNTKTISVYGGPGDDHVILAKPDARGRVWMVGYTKSAGAGGWDVMVTRLERDGQFADGALLLGGPGDDNGAAILPLKGGDILVGGYSKSLGGSSEDGFVARLDAVKLAKPAGFKVTKVK